MAEYIEWKNLKRIIDEKNIYSNEYLYETGERFFIEPVFYIKLQGFKQQFPDRYDSIINEMKRLVLRNKCVVFIGDEDEEITQVDGAIYLTIQDVTNPLQIFAEDKSRGSDYGD